MPDIVRLRYIGAAPRTVPALEREVEPDTLVEFPGKIVADGPDDAVLIESGNPPEVRAWPASLWRNETITSRGKSKE